MREVHPEVFLVARPAIDWDEVDRYLEAVGGAQWADQSRDRSDAPDGEVLTEFMGRLCYRSWKPGLNPNVRRVRTDSDAYFENILSSGHGSVIEHANYAFVFHNVSRVFTHELVRHRAGVAISQESLRFVRLTEIPLNHPDFVRDNPVLLDAAHGLLSKMAEFQQLVVAETGIDGDKVPFSRKKTITSGARRYAPDGVATSIGWTANIRAIRHVVAMRTEPSAEAEIRLVFDKVGQLMAKELPSLFRDFRREEDGTWRPQYRKV